MRNVCKAGIAAFALFVCSGAQAQEAPAPAPEPDFGQLAPIASSPNTNPVQQVAPQQGIPGAFPALPPSRPCEDRDLANHTWKLGKVFETPAGVATASVTAQPNQYYLFNRDKTYLDYRTAYTDAPGEIRKLATEQNKNALQQYVMHESGILFLYKDGVVSDSQACFIVANRQDPFQVGDMLLMPPADQVTSTRVVKVYAKASNTNEKKPKNAGDKKNKKKKKGKHRGRNATIHRNGNPPLE